MLQTSMRLYIWMLYKSKLFIFCIQNDYCHCQSVSIWLSVLLCRVSQFILRSNLGKKRKTQTGNLWKPIQSLAFILVGTYSVVTSLLLKPSKKFPRHKMETFNRGGFQPDTISPAGDFSRRSINLKPLKPGEEGLHHAESGKEKPLWEKNDRVENNPRTLRNSSEHLT